MKVNVSFVREPKARITKSLFRKDNGLFIKFK